MKLLSYERFIIKFSDGKHPNTLFKVHHSTNALNCLLNLSYRNTPKKASVNNRTGDRKNRNIKNYVKNYVKRFAIFSRKKT